MRITLTLVALSLSLHLHANDGAFFISGNHLIPTAETEIEVKKEILTLKKIQNQYLEVTVYYEFLNPKEAKEIIVGFEAFQPAGDVSFIPKNGGHPYMRDFTVNLNNKILPHKVALVGDSLYAKVDLVKSKDYKDFESFNDFYYVYYFSARFKQGINVIKHTYNFDLSGGVELNYDFKYILTAANRWANKQIDDFTLVIDNGAFECFDIQKSFFDSKEDWLINGLGKSEERRLFDLETVRFYVQKGNLIFQKKNFSPKGELNILSQRFFPYAKPNYLPFSYYQLDGIPEPKNDYEKKVYRNLPFARRGYVFKSPELRRFYENLDWYLPNPNYVPELETLNPLEIAWIEKYK
ncbi:MAG: YARHG domain-containing protein [Cyanothece sp. SIO1E1]|nr:YARHG domain-containing protein [Cyanothece sp. SIO1E1]